MENSYGVGVVNRYALFLEDEADPLDTLRAKELDRERRRKHREAEKENKPKIEARPVVKQQQNAAPPAAPAPAAPRRDGPASPPAATAPPPRDQQPRRDAAPQGAKGAPGPRPDRPPQQRRPLNNGPAAEGGEQQPRPPRREFAERRPNNNFVPREPREPREGEAVGERRGGGARGGGRGRGGYEGRGKREFDRRSGSDRTGVKPVDKRDGGGSHNWGSHKDDLEDFNKTQSEGEQTDPEKTEAPAAPPAENKETEEEAPAAPAEEETKEFTLDEWKAIKGSRQKPQYNIRKAGEGEDLSQWKDMVALQKIKAEGEDSDDEYESAEFPQRVGRQKKVEGIEFTFYENRRGGGAGGRGGRGGRGGGRGRGGPRPQREERGPMPTSDKPSNARQNAPKVNDNKDFPSLG